MVERILLKRSVQHRVKTPPNVTFLHICDPVIWFKNQGSYSGFAKEGKISILWLSYGGSDHLLVIEDDIIEKHLVLLTTPLSPSLAMFRINNLPSTIWSVDCSKDWPHWWLLQKRGKGVLRARGIDAVKSTGLFAGSIFTWRIHSGYGWNKSET